MTHILATPGMPSRQTVSEWICTDAHGFAADHARARCDGVEAQVDEAMEAARDRTRDPQQARLLVDTIKWHAAKIAPRLYGDRVEVVGDAAAPLMFAIRRLDRPECADELPVAPEVRRLGPGGPDDGR